MAEKLLHSEITEIIIASYFNLNKAMQYGLPTEIYRNALAVEFENNNLTIDRNVSIEVKYRNKPIGNLVADFIINQKVMVLLFNVEMINRQYEEEAKHFLRYSQYEVCIMLNRKGDSEYKRILFTNDFKKI